MDVPSRTGAGAANVTEMSKQVAVVKLARLVPLACSGPARAERLLVEDGGQGAAAGAITRRSGPGQSGDGSVAAKGSRRESVCATFSPPLLSHQNLKILSTTE
jgi:hypothetical protein